jgi:hypothetical protein
MSAKYDITVKNLERANFRPIHAGDDYSHDFTVTRNGAALDLSGGKLWFTIKEDSTVEDTSAKLQVDSDGTDIDITGPSTGEFTVHFRDDKTAGLEGKWPYDIKARLGGAGSPILRIARGVIEFLPNLTREIA